MVDKPTRQRQGQTPNLLDLVLTKNPDAVNSITHRCPLGKSDHDILLINIDLNITGTRKPFIKKKVWAKGDYDAIRRDITSQNLQEELMMLDVNDGWNLFASTLANAADKHVPSSTFNPDHHKRKKPVWMNDKALRKVKKKQKAYRRYLLTREGRDYTDYIDKRNKATKAVRKAVREYERRIARDSKVNAKSFWSYYKSKTKPKDTIPTLLDEHGVEHTSDKEKAEALNNFFAGVFNTEDTSHIPHIATKHVSSELNDLTVSAEEILTKLSKLDTSKTPGDDGLHPKLLYETRQEITPLLKIIFNKSLQTCTVPSAWKQSKVTALHKKGDKSNPGNYRPISLTAICSKVLESIVRDAIMKHLETQRLLSECQHGFVGQRNCTTNLLESLDNWTSALDSGKCVDAILLDFAKAFDSVPHNRLLSKIRSYGITGKTLKWIESFLEGRTQYVQVGQEVSSTIPVTSGVPQGSVLGPTLFVLFINDLPDSVSSFVRLFADDAKTSDTVDKEMEKSPQLQQDLRHLGAWTQTWKLGFQPPKCLFFPVGHTPEYTYELADLSGKTSELTQVSTTKDLGVTLDKNLNFKEHMNSIIKKANGVLFTIKRTLVTRNRETIMPLYKALVRPLVEYAQEVWAPHQRGDIERLEKIQRRATKLIPDISNMSYENRLKSLNLPTLAYRRQRGDMITTYKIVNQKLKCNLPLMRSHTRTRGHNQKLYLPRWNTTRRGTFFTNRVVMPWNNLPAHVINAPSVNAFKGRLDKCWKNRDILYNFSA